VKARAICLALAVACAAPAAAQQAVPAGDANPDGVRFLTRSAFHLNAQRLSGDDRRFIWDTSFGGDIDFVDYGTGRLVFIADYQAVLGDELRAFDPNQGNYTLAASASARLLPTLELAGVFHHASRHLSDRAKQEPVDWNMLGARGVAAWQLGNTTLRGSAGLLGVVQKSRVDYRWELNAAIDARIRITPHVAGISSFAVRALGVDGSQNRGTQGGFRAEGGLRFQGGAAAVELFLAAERRIDPYPLEFSTITWASAGFRLLSR
jgi:hypothetical protein